MEQPTGETITVQFDQRGQLLSVDLGGGKIAEPTHNFYDNPPPGEYVGSFDLGRIYVYRQANPTRRICFHYRCMVF